MLIIKRLFTGTAPLEKYLRYSVYVTVIDVIAVWLLTRLLGVELVRANTIGVLLGFSIHYLLASKRVFNASYGGKGFAVYLVTFVLGVFLANGLIYSAYHYLFSFLGEDLRFLLSKAVSIVGPFFALFYLRKFLFRLLRRHG